MAKVIALLSISTVFDQYGYNTDYAEKLYNLKDLLPLGYVYIAHTDVYDVDCPNKRIIKVGDVIKDPAYQKDYGTYVLKARYQGNIVYLYQFFGVQLRDLLNGCCNSEANVVPDVTPLNVDVSVAGQVTVSGGIVDSDGAALFQLYEGDNLLGSDNSAPFSITAVLAKGFHTLIVRAVDSKGVATHIPISATVA